MYDYKSIINLYRKYSDEVLQNNQEIDKDLLIGEVIKKLEQLSFLMEEIVKDNNDVMKVLKHIQKLGMSGEEPKLSESQRSRMHKTQFRISLFTESYYYLAWRLLCILGKGPDQGIQCEGIRNVRNKLLEHSDRPDSKVTFPSMSMGNPDTGPVIKGLRYTHQKDIWVDKGLYINSQELIDNLQSYLNKWLETR